MNYTSRIFNGARNQFPYHNVIIYFVSENIFGRRMPTAVEIDIIYLIQNLIYRNGTL